MSKKMGKEELQRLAHFKINKMKVSELKEFLGVDQPLIKLLPNKIPETFKIDIQFAVQSYNNSNCGRNSSGGELYKRALILIKNQDFNSRELEISVRWFVPSGFGDGNISTEKVSFILNDKDLIGMNDHGVRDYLKALFKIPYVLQHNKEIPYTLPQ